jgi:hypothetical protein
MPIVNSDTDLQQPIVSKNDDDLYFLDPTTGRRHLLSSLERFKTAEIAEPHEAIEGFIHNPAGALPFATEREPTLRMASDKKYIAAGILPANHGQTQATVKDDDVYDISSLGGEVPLDSISQSQDMGSTNGLAVPSTISNDDPFANMVGSTNQQVSVDTLDIAPQTMVYDFGPFYKMEKHLNELARDELDSSIEDDVIREIRQVIHREVVTNKSLHRPEHTESGLVARIGAIADIEKAFAKAVETIATTLGPRDIDSFRSFEDSAKAYLSSEKKELESRQAHLRVPTLGESVILAAKRAMAPGNPQLVGNARLHRNKEMLSAMSQLRSTAGELRDNAGNPEWMAGHGKMCTDTVNSMTKRIRSLSSGVEDQIDGPAIKRGLEEAGADLTKAKDSTTDENRKKDLEESVKQMMDYIRELFASLGKILTKSGGPTP